jgi:hypothetical protein
MAIPDEWVENVKKQHRANKESAEKSLIDAYGAQAHKAKVQNFIDLVC